MTIFTRRSLPWWIAGIFAIGFFALLFARAHPRPSSERRILYWRDPMFAQGPPHNYTSDKPGVAPDCGMKLVPVYAEAPTEHPNADAIAMTPERQQLIGVKLAKAEVRNLSRTLRTAGAVTIDERRRARVQTKFDGFLESVDVNTIGQRVSQGQRLFSIYSPDLVSTEQDLLLAAKNKGALGSTFYDAARRRLLLWGLSANDIDAIERRGQPQRSIAFHSPVDGVVLAKNAVAGSKVMAGDTLYDLADLRQVWVTADVYESELPYIRVGSIARVSVGGREWNGRVAFIAPVLDPAARTAKVRIELPNPDGYLKPDMFADVILDVPIGAVLVVPESAVMQTGQRAVVFVAHDGNFESRIVQAGARVNGLREIRSGLQAGETVATEANFLIDSEARLKAAVTR
jgi:membrane fusion protein, copper/silver efflux system